MNTTNDLKRLDVFLFEEGYFSSREKARQAIMENSVEVNGKIVNKPAFQVSNEFKINIVKIVNPFVGRGGLKLEKAITDFSIQLEGLRVLDVGASTGGFTDCVLKRGASFVCAVDVGRDQLDPSLRKDPRVLSLEETDIRQLESNPAGFGVNELFDFITVDVSFISLTKIIPSLKSLLKENGRIVCLIKPQFEAGRKNISKGGIVKDPKVHKVVVSDVTKFAEAAGFRVQGLIESPVKGGDGNKEFLIYLIK